MKEHQDLLNAWAESDWQGRSADVQRILIQAGRSKMQSWYYDFLSEMSLNQEEDIAREAAEVLLKLYGNDDVYQRMLNSSSKDVRQQAVYFFFQDDALPDKQTARKLLQIEEYHQKIVDGLIDRVKETPRLLPELFERYKTAENELERTGYARVLSTRIRYFIMQIDKEDAGEIRELIDDIITLRLSSPIINFLNINKNLSKEKLLLEAIAPHFHTHEYFLHQCQMYLNPELKKKLNLPPLPRSYSTKKIQLTLKDRQYLIALAALTLSVPFVIFFLLKGAILPFMSREEKLVSFIFMYHSIFAVYTVAINSIYFFLLIQSWKGFHEKQLNWESAGKKFLYTSGILPSVTILAPAYNEESTIAESIYSLLSLRYPDSELIVINDGSSDSTMETLVSQFDLQLVDYSLNGTIETSPVRGLYKNDRIPNLLVIDKENGGKADALNTGLNIASGEYICSIDSDSLLEPESLTKMMFQTLIRSERTVAVGGNIIPVNGCRVEKGAISEVHVAQNKYARYQTIEYLRSFITGRMGWARMNMLMIISGAFGAFRRQDVMDIGGYMTGKGTQKKDTVGEDMELVVRLTRHLHEQKIKYFVDYAPNANCWTEVPDNLKDLMKQRDRWQRVLIENLVYHRKMLLNRNYGITGLLVFPYFYLFELLGPFWETGGYFVLILTLLLGLLSSKVFLVMFSIVVLFGILISSTALFLSEKGILTLPKQDFGRLVSRAVMENLGFRQLISMYRTFTYFSYLTKNKDWQKFKRIGFNSSGDHIRSNSTVRVIIIAAVSAIAVAFTATAVYMKYLRPGGHAGSFTYAVSDIQTPEKYKINQLEWPFQNSRGYRKESPAEVFILSSVVPAEASDEEALRGIDSVKERAKDSSLLVCNGLLLNSDIHPLYRNLLQDYIQVEPSGWSVIYSREKDPSLVFQHESGKIITLKGKEHFNGRPPNAQFREHSANIYSWIPIYKAAGATRVTTLVNLGLNQKGGNLLQEAGIPEDIPLIMENYNYPTATAFFTVNIYHSTPVSERSWLFKRYAYNLKTTLYKQGSNDELYWRIFDPWIDDLVETITATNPKPMVETEKTIFTTDNSQFYIKIPGEDTTPFYIKGVNLGTALPGKWFTEPPERERLYYHWFTSMKEIHLNTLRVYTLLPPSFYRAFRKFNLDHPADPLYLIQEIWPEENPPNKDYLERQYDETYRKEITLNIDALHGKGNIQYRLHQAWGNYSNDVTPWLIGYLIGRELEPEEVEETNQRNPEYIYHGNFVSAPRGPATEAWLAAMVDHAISYETETYGTSHPMGIVSWPLLDPQHHPVEWNDPRLQGKTPPTDRIEMDINRLIVENNSFGGLFGAYHIYPNYPDFMNNQSSYAEYRDDKGVFRYGGYLNEFIRTQVKYPAIVAEYGISTSAAEAHHSPDGYHHGGLSEDSQAEGIIRMTEAIRREGYGGSIIFEWIDEWAKKTWTTEPFMIPYNRHALWHNPLDPEQNYGIVAMAASSERSFKEHAAADSPIKIQLWGSEAHLYIRINYFDPDVFNLQTGKILFGFDTYAPNKGILNFPNLPDFSTPTGMESIAEISLKENKARILNATDYNIGNNTFGSSSRESQTFDPIKILINAAYTNERGIPVPAYFTEWGELHTGPLDEARNSFYTDNESLTLRIPWGLLNVSDPSTGFVLDNPEKVTTVLAADQLNTANSREIRVYGVLIDNSNQVLFQFPELSYTWGKWDKPEYTETPKKSVRMLSEYFSQIE